MSRHLETSQSKVERVSTTRGHPYPSPPPPLAVEPCPPVTAAVANPRKVTGNMSTSEISIPCTASLGIPVPLDLDGDYVWAAMNSNTKMLNDASV